MTIHDETLLTAPRSPITGVNGWESESEELALMEYARKVPKDGLILEIGAEHGMSAAAFCYAAGPSVKIVSIDLFPQNLLKIHRANLKQAGFAGRSEQVPMDSKDFPLNNRIKIDLLFIDGDHSIDGVRSDLTRFAPHVNVGGFMALHDMAQETNRSPHITHFDVTFAFTEWYAKQAGRWQVSKMVDTLLVMERVAK